MRKTLYYWWPCVRLGNSFGEEYAKFQMRCFMKNYEQGNNAIRKRHPTLLKDKKDHYYSFGPSDELVQTLPFEFVDNSKGGAYIKLPSKWMSYIWSKLTQSQRNLIISIQLVRSLLPSKNLRCVFLPTVEPDKKTRYIYEAFIEKSIFFVSHGQISIVCAMWHLVEKYGWLLDQRESPWIGWK
jgi:hypothetical protein